MLAGVVRKAPMSFEEADGARPNPFFKAGSRYRANCQSCVVVYEARRRGFDVEVNPFSKKGKMGELSRDTALAWREKRTDRRPKPKPLTGMRSVLELREELEQSVEKGRRYHLGFDWKMSPGEGHIVTMERDGSGVLMLYDPQNGAIIKQEELDKYLTRVALPKKGPFARGYYPPDLLRVDDLDFDKEYADEIMREAST